MKKLTIIGECTEDRLDETYYEEDNEIEDYEEIDYRMHNLLFSIVSKTTKCLTYMNPAVCYI